MLGAGMADQGYNSTRAPAREACWRSPAALGSSRHAKIGEVAAGPIPDPDSHLPASPVAQFVDHERRRGGTVHEHADLGPLDHDAHVKPLIAVRLRSHGRFVLARMLRPQLLPWEAGLGDVLHRVTMPRGICRAKVERPEVDRLVDRKSTR